MKKPPYRITSATRLKSAFPDSAELPDLVVRFADWLKGKPWGSVGCFNVQPGDAGDLAPADANISGAFAMVLRMPDGGLAGIWLTHESDATRAPFVLVSSGGELIELAPNFAGFLDRLARQVFSQFGPDADFLVAEDVAAQTDALQDWLAQQRDAQAQIKANAVKDYLKFDKGKAAKWLDAEMQRADEARKSDPALVALRDVLLRHRLTRKKRQSDPPQFGMATFRVFAAGDRMRIKKGIALIVTKGVNDLQEIDPAAEAELIPHLFKLREAHAQKKTGEGLWPSATLSLLMTGEVYIECNYDHPFAIGYKQFPAKRFADDHARYPRKTSKLQPWHKALIDAGKAD